MLFIVCGVTWHCRASSAELMPCITNATARRVLQAAIVAAQPSAITVVDASGHLSAFASLDGAAPQATQIAQARVNAL